MIELLVLGFKSNFIECIFWFQVKRSFWFQIKFHWTSVSNLMFILVSNQISFHVYYASHLQCDISSSEWLAAFDWWDIVSLKFFAPKCEKEEDLNTWPGPAKTPHKELAWMGPSSLKVLSSAQKWIYIQNYTHSPALKAFEEEKCIHSCLLISIAIAHTHLGDIINTFVFPIYS